MGVGDKLRDDGGFGDDVAIVGKAGDEAALLGCILLDSLYGVQVLVCGGAIPG